MKEQLRKSAISLTLSTRAGARIALRCAQDERFLLRLLEDPIFSERVLGVPYLKKKLIEVLTREPLLDSLLGDEVFQSAAVDPLLDTDDFASRVALNKHTLRDVLRKTRPVPIRRI